MSHSLKRAWTDADTVVCESEVVYTKHADGRTFTLPTATVIRRDPADGLIHEMRIYIDPTPMAADPQAESPDLARSEAQDIDG